ncbi:MAG TPA: hypothetical protein VF572_07420 [Candidatus Saccharimonadales bacterium]|jgi:guanylate kinase
MTDDLIRSYEPNLETVTLIAQTPIVLLVGISGAGKDSIKKMLLQSGKYHHIVSHTTRKPRVNSGVMETDGVEYHFISEKTARQMLQDGAFVEAKLVHGTMYGTSSAEISQAKREGKIALTDLDVQGVAEYMAMSEYVTALFVLPPDYEEWQRRLYARYGEHQAEPADIAKRMQTATSELEEALKQPYYHFIVNNDLHEAVATADLIAHGLESAHGHQADMPRKVAISLLERIRRA